jgi:outer membrane protein assembly factor BamB
VATRRRDDEAVRVGFRGPAHRALLAGVLLALAASVGPGLGAAGAASKPRRTAPSTGTNWTVYHGDPAGRGTAGSIRLAAARQRWVSPGLDGQLYGEPLVDRAMVLVATENDTVYALSATTGAIRWSAHLGTPVPSSELPCGDIEPTVGITSTPVVDTVRNEVFVVAFVAQPAGPVHQLIGLSLDRGTVLLRQNADPPGINTRATLQRVALTLDDGDVVFGYGGNDGDCSTYHGWVVAVPEGGGAMRTYEVDAAPGDDQGAIWMGGAAPEIDAKGDIWLAVGNGSVTTSGRPYDDSDSVLELSGTLGLLQYFAPSGWPSDNAHDRDLGSAAPALLADGLVVQAGKSETAYLLSQSGLGGVGGQLAELGSFCGGDVDGGSAVVGSVVYLPCENGVEAVRVQTSPPRLTPLWQATNGVGGPPIVAGGFVWSIGQNGELVAFNRSNGAVVQQFALGSIANHFPTPSVGAGRLFAPGSNRVFAYSA